MPTKKIPISFNEEDQTKIQELIGLMNIRDTYGDVPKALKFGIRLALSAIKSPEKVYTHLNDGEMEQYFQSVALSERRQRMKFIAENLLSEANKV